MAQLWPPAIPQSLGDGIESFSVAIDQISSPFTGSNRPTDALLASIGGGNNGGSTFRRAPAGDFHIAASLLSFAALRENLERVNKAIFAATKAGVVGGEVSTRFDLQGDASLRNPQFQASLLRQLYATQRLILASLDAIVRAGVAEHGAQIVAATNADDRARYYAIFAGGFNSWVDAHAKINRYSSANLKLRVDAEFDPSDKAMIEVQVARAVEISKSLKISHSTSASISRADAEEESLPKQVLDGLQQVFTGALSSWVQDPDYLVSIRVQIYESLYQSIEVGEGYSKLVTEWWRSETAELSISKLPMYRKLPSEALKFFGVKALESLAIKYLTSEGIDPNLAKCIIELSSGAFSLVGASVAAFNTGGILVSLAAVEALGLISKIQECVKNNPEVAQSVKDALKDFFVGSDASAGRSVPAETNPAAAECDQIARAGLVQQTISANTASATADKNAAANRLTDPTQSDRTADQLSRDALALILDYLERNKQVLGANLSGTNPSFFGTGQAGISRRPPGATSGTLPSISEGEIMCTSPGRIPKRNPPGTSVNLATMPSFPFLQPNTAISPGGSVNVR